MMVTDNAQFLSKFPARGYHVPGGMFENDVKKGYSFECGCGRKHAARDAYAVREHREEGSAIYACPNNDYLLNLVEPEGLFRVKGIKTIASYLGKKDDVVFDQIFAYTQMNESNQNSLSEYFS